MRWSAAGVGGGSVLFAVLALRVWAVFIDPDPWPSDGAMGGPSSAHWLGTDAVGRDLFLRVVESTEAFVGPGLVACAVALLLGTLAGAAVGYVPDHPVSKVLRGVLTLLSAWPRLVLVVVLLAVFLAGVSDPSAWAPARVYVLGALVGLSFVPQVAGVLSERVAHFRRARFVDAARAHGLTDVAILGRHILWANCRQLLLRQACSVFGAFLLVETSLSYLGDYGVPEPRPSWGNILADMRSAVVRSGGIAGDSGWVEAARSGGLLGVVVPSLAIVATIAGALALAEYFAQRDAEA